MRQYLPRQTPKTPFQYIKKTIEIFVKKFARSAVKDSEYQLELAGWYFDNRRFATGYIILAEAIITYMCELKGRRHTVKNNRDEMKNLLLTEEENKNTQLAHLYSTINPIRNSIAHALLEDKYDVNDAIFYAKNYYQQAKRIFSTGTLKE
ncbi:hypothetical protein B4U84_28940 [Westiellopsis prolifica IICB1]|nr:hypothetical protein B4U84_28940 [Westiellopsis prolifica IICB1]